MELVASIAAGVRQGEGVALSKVRGRPPCPHPRACTDKATMCSYLERDCVPLLMGFLCPSVPPGPRQFAVSLALSRLLPAPSSPAPLRCLPVQRHNWLPGAPEYFKHLGRQWGQGWGGTWQEWAGPSDCELGSSNSDCPSRALLGGWVHWGRNDQGHRALWALQGNPYRRLGQSTCRETSVGFSPV